MKKLLSVTLALVMIATTLFALPFTAQADDETANCAGKVVEVSSYTELKTALQSSDNANATIRLTSNIDERNMTVNPAIAIPANCPITLDLNGYHLFVKSTYKTAASMLFRQDTNCGPFYVVNSGSEGYIEYNNDFYDSSLSVDLAYQTGYASIPSVFYVASAKLYMYNVSVYYNDYYFGKYADTSNDSGHYQGNCIRSIGNAVVSISKSKLYNRAQDGQGIYAQGTGNTGAPGHITLSGGTLIKSACYGVTSTSSSCEKIHLNECTINAEKGQVYCNGAKISDVIDNQLYDSFSYGGSSVSTSSTANINDYSANEITVETGIGGYCCGGPSGRANALYYAGGHISYCAYCQGNLLIDEHDMQKISDTATCLSKGWLTKKCSVCEYTSKTLSPAKGHTAVTIRAKAATCTAEGATAGKKCLVCGEVLVEPKAIPMLEHTPEVIPAVAPTCTSVGYTEGSRCSECGEIITAQSEIAMLAHTPEVIPAKAPTCTATGLTAGSKCSVCGEVITAQTTVAATGHKTKTTTTKATYAKAGKEETKCTVCGKVISSKTLPKLTVPKITLSSVKSKKSKQITVKWKKNTKVTGYEIQYSTDKNFKKSVKKTKINKNKTTSATIKKLKGNKKYYVRIRAYKTSGGKNYYSKWSKAMNVKTKK